MLDANEEEWVIYKSLKHGYVNCTEAIGYQSWAETHKKDVEFWPVIVRGLTQEQAEAMVDMATED